MQDKKQKQSLAERFEAYQSAPTDKVWNNIEAQLDEDKRKRGLLWWWSANAAILLLTVGTFYYMRSGANTVTAKSSTQLTILQQDNGETEKAQSTTSSTSNKGQMNETSTSSNATNNEPDQHSIENNEPVNNNGSVQRTPTNTGTSTRPSISVIGGDSELQRPAQPNLSIVAEVENPDQNETREEESIDPLSTRSLSMIPTPKQPGIASTIDYSYFEQENRWEIGLRFGQFYTTNRKFPSIPPDTPSGGDGSTTTSGGNTIYSVNQGNQVVALEIAEYKNRTYGELEVFAQRRYAKRLFISLGISASYTARSYTHTVKDTYTNAIKITEIDRQYWNIGIPLHAKFSIVQRGAFDLGLGAGLISEYRILKSSPEQQVFNALNSPAENGFMFSAQPYLFSSYSFRNSKLFIEAGYRKNMSDQTERNVPARANYLVGNIGISWKLR